MLWRIPAAIRILQSLTEKPKYLSRPLAGAGYPRLQPLPAYRRAGGGAAHPRQLSPGAQRAHEMLGSQALAGYGVRLAGRPEAEAENKEYSVEMPIGMFTRCSISAPCGMTGREGNIGVFDNPAAFFCPREAPPNAFGFTPVLSIIPSLPTPFSIIAAGKSPFPSRCARKPSITTTSGRATSPSASTAGSWSPSPPRAISAAGGADIRPNIGR